MKNFKSLTIRRLVGGVILGLTLIFNKLYSQNPGFDKYCVLFMKHHNHNIVPINDSQSNDINFNQILTNNNVGKYFKLFPNEPTNTVFGDIYIIHCKDNSGFDTSSFLSDIDAFSGIEYRYFVSSTPLESFCSTPVSINDPFSDNNNNPLPNDANWPLLATNAYCGWNYSTGINSTNSNKAYVAILEGFIDASITELDGKIDNFKVPQNLWNTNNIPNYNDFTETHGTHVAGSAIAKTNNNYGIAGIGHSLRIKHYESGFVGLGKYDWYYTLINIEIAAKYAKDNNERVVINCSFTNPFHGIDAQNRLKDLVDQGVVFVFAAGNRGMDGMYYYTKDIPGVIVVGAIDKNFNVCFDPNHIDLSNRYTIGPEVDIYAPGYGLITTGLNNEFTNVYGTSIAAPIVSAAIGLMLDINPLLTPSQIECYLKNNYNPVNDKSDYPDQVLTGRLNLRGVLQKVADDATNHNWFPLTNITGNEVFNTNTYVKSDITINNGATLTINNSTIYFYKGKKIIVKEGGTLIVNNSILTNYSNCSNPNIIDNMWGGILIRSHGPGQSQSKITSGYVEIKNNSIIENAVFGVDMGEWHASTNNTGGILDANNSVFKNCRYSIKMGLYISPTVPEENLTILNNIDFINDKVFTQFNFQSTNTHAWIHGVRGVKFQGCRFINEVKNFFPRGIGSWDAKFWVTKGHIAMVPSSCINIPMGRNSEFINLSHGIHSVGSNYDWNRHQTIGAKFKNCLNGIWMGNDLLSEVIDCEFDIDNNLSDIPIDPNNPNIPSVHQIYAKSSKGFSIVDSRFDFKINRNSGSANLFSLKTFSARDGNSGGYFFRSEVAKCKFENTASNYYAIGNYFMSVNYNFYLYCNYYSENLSKAWAGSDGSYLNSQKGQNKSNYLFRMNIPNPNTTVNNIFEYCINSNPSIQGIASQLFNTILNPNQPLATPPFQYHVLNPNTTEYPSGQCLQNATLPDIISPPQWSQQCDFYNPEPWFKMEDVFCRSSQFPLIPLRNRNVVTGLPDNQTGPNIENDSSTNDDFINISNQNKLNEFMENHNIDNNDLLKRDTSIRNKIIRNLKSYSLNDKESAYDILIHFFEEEGFKVIYLSEDIKKTNKTNLSFKNQNQTNFNIHPNPSSSGYFQIQTDLKYDKIEIYSIEGKLIQEVSEISNISIMNFKIENNGFFIIKVFNNKRNIFQTKLMVVNH